MCVTHVRLVTSAHYVCVHGAQIYILTLIEQSFNREIHIDGQNNGDIRIFITLPYQDNDANPNIKDSLLG